MVVEAAINLMEEKYNGSFHFHNETFHFHRQRKLPYTFLEASNKFHGSKSNSINIHGGINLIPTSMDVGRSFSVDPYGSLVRAAGSL